MKRILCMMLAGILLLPLACGPAPEPSAQVPDARRSTDPTAAPDATFEPAPENGGYADFANALCAKLIDGTRNRNISPISAYLAMAMVAEGAEGETRAELLRLLGCESVERLRAVCAAMLHTLSIDEEESTLDLHNALWMADRIDGRSVAFRESYLTSLGTTYGAEANTVDFSDASASEQIANWITKHTRDKIKISPDALTFDPGTLAVLINTIYLKDRWSEPFEKDRTEPGTFFGLDEKAQHTERTVDYMHRWDANAVITRGDGFLRYRMPLRGVGEVVFVLPDEGIELSSLLGGRERIAALLADGTETTADVDVMVPRFRFQDKAELTEVLAALGLKKSFSSEADFSNMSDTPARIDRVLQESYIGMNEDGVEAAAYTMAMMRAMSGVPVERERIDFHLTRPFLFAIEGTDGTLLFFGTVALPNEAA